MVTGSVASDSLEMKAVRRLKLIKVGLLIALSLTTGVAAVSATFGQGGKVVKVAPPPKPMPSPAKLDLGKIEGLTYTNDQLGFSFSAPPTWTVLDAYAMSAQRESAKAIFRDEKDARLRANLESSIDRSTLLFSSTKYAPGTSGVLQATLSSVAERIPTAIVKTPRDYYDSMLHSMNLTVGLNVEVIEPFRTKKIGTTVFGIYTIKVTTNVGIALERVLIAIKAPYAYGLFYSYVDDEDAATFAEVLNSVKTK